MLSLNRPTGEDGKVFSVLFTVGISNIINLGKGQWLRNSHNSLFFCYIYNMQKAACVQYIIIRVFGLPLISPRAQP